MHFEILVEEISAEKAINILIPKIFKFYNNISCKIHPFQGKKDLIKKLPHRLKAYKKWMPNNYRIVVLVDQDKENCTELKNELDRIAHYCGLPTKSSPNHQGNFVVLNRIAIEELESWFFGDANAITKAYPNINPNFENKAKYRDPDQINDTWETLERLMKRHGYYKTGLPKTEVARNIAAYMDPDMNRSKSFQVFRDGLLSIINK